MFWRVGDGARDIMIHWQKSVGEGEQVRSPDASKEAFIVPYFSKKSLYYLKPNLRFRNLVCPEFCQVIITPGTWVTFRTP